MFSNKNVDRICIAVIVVALVVTVLFMFSEKLGVKKIVDEDSEGHESVSGFSAKDLDGDWDTSDAVRITLDDAGTDISGDGAYVYENTVVIKNAGKYILSGTLSDGSIVVDAYESSKVWLMFDNVSVYRSDDAAFRVNCADKVFLTLADGTKNRLESGETYSESAVSDGTGGVIYSHDDLTINGSGSLDITSSYKHGIECNDTLVIAGGNIDIEAAGDGINVNDGVNFTGAGLHITAEDDGISAGDSFIMAGGSITVSKCYEGIEALTIDIRDGDIDIYCTDDGLNANGDTGDFGKRPGEAADTSTQDEEKEETWIHISGGNLTVRNDTGRDCDGLDSNGDIVISGGNIRISVPGDGNNCALDWGSESGGKCTVSGGTLIACGGSSMVEAVDAATEQSAILYFGDEITDDGDVAAIRDESGNTVLEWEVPFGYTAVYFSSPDIAVGKQYTVVTGENEETVTIETTSSTFGEAAGGFGGEFGQGHDRGFGGPGGKGERPDGEMPEGGFKKGEPPEGGFPKGDFKKRGEE